MTADADLLARLQKMEQEWKNAPVGNAGSELIGIEDGEGYQGRIEAFEMFPGKKDPSALYLKTAASIQNHSEHAGRPISRLDNVMDPTKLGYLKDFLYRLDVDVENLSLTELRPGSETLEGLLDVYFSFDIYTNQKGYRNWAVRNRLGGSDLGTAQEQIAGFENNETPAEAKAKSGLDKVNETIERDFKNKPANCICKDPAGGDFDEKCPVAGHGIEF
jgi:hypothetical protein